MGIQGLLPVLKPIQRRKHLSELSGKTIAVDGYVWLHRGAYTCAPELVQKIPTRRFVDYCMARVRMLRHHGITPYIVFDGGPLPAKLGTEKEREKKRAENIKRAYELKAVGKQSQAREYFVKCLDVTPQIAYQFIKALKAENVSYVVAPYEADAQLAYLERMGIVDGILTEDSDLLVFGCQNVFFKFDTASASVISISRKDFGSPALAKDSFSFIGWSDNQFRWMAMLSGCDYLPSIQGIGLKTAYELVKKYKTIDKALQMLRLEGKRSIPGGYREAFLLAEKVFLHQRVYDPQTKQIVYLTDPPGDMSLSEEVETFIGRYLDQPIVQSIAEGDMCPISLSKMVDINPSFSPNATKPLPLRPRNTNIQKSLASPRTKGSLCKRAGLLDFFAPLPKKVAAKLRSPVKGTPSKRPPKHAVAGTSSGKRTLVDVMDQDIEAKRRRLAQEDEITSPKAMSRFFKHARPLDVVEVDDDDDIEDLGENNSLSAQCTDDLREDELWESVEQEDGYMTPSPSISRKGTPELSSPALHRTLSAPRRLDMGGAVTQNIPTQEIIHIFVRGSSEPAPDIPQEQRIPGPDLRENFGDDDINGDSDTERLSESDISEFWEDVKVVDSPVTILSQGSSSGNSKSGEWVDLDEEDIREEQARARRESLAQKWRATYSLPSIAYSAGSLGTPKNHATSSKRDDKPKRTTSTSNRQSEKKAARASGSAPRINAFTTFNRGPKAGSKEKPISVDSDEIEDTIIPVKGSFDSFRFVG